VQQGTTEGCRAATSRVKSFNARAEGTAPLMEKETASLLGRIGAIFGFKQKGAPLDRATGT
jgi:hypothetical protein